MRKSSSSAMLDAVIVGGGPAGLQAALTIARVHRRALLLDSGQYRNGTVSHAHNLIGHDGAPPARLRETARAEIAQYETIDLRDAEVTEVRRIAGGFAVTFTGGETTARAVILATGMRDDLPDVPGLAEVWGGRAAQCPFCHAHEFAGHPIALLGEGDHLAFAGELLRPVASEVIPIAPADLRRIDSTPDGLRLTLANAVVEAAAVFLAPTPSQRSALPARLGLTLLPSGCVEVDAFARTSMPGVYAAGDMAHVATLPGPMVSLAAAIASGQLAAAGALRDGIAGFLD